MDGNVLKIKNDDGSETSFDILFTFDSDDTGKSYVIYTDHKKNSEGDVLVYTSCYNTFDENPVLEDVKEEKELNTIEEILNTIDFES